MGEFSFWGIQIEIFSGAWERRLLVVIEIQIRIRKNFKGKNVSTAREARGEKMFSIFNLENPKKFKGKFLKNNFSENFRKFRAEIF